MTPADASSARHERPIRASGWGRLHDFALGALVLVFLLGVPFLRSGSSTAGLHVRRADVSRRQIDINRAEWYEWMLLENIGEARGRAIVEYRRAHGPFKSVDDLASIPGIPRGWLSRAVEHLTIRSEYRDDQAQR